MTLHETVMERFPVRRSAAEKADFRQWLLETAQGWGYSARVEDARKNQNVIVGTPDTARVIVTAHYDTPPVMPVPNLITPANRLVYLAYQMGLVAVMLLAALLANFAGMALGMSDQARYFLCLGVYWILLFLLMCGPSNRHNANDNTSGVAAVLQLMETLPAESRDGVAFIFFDNEEKGMRGSKAYAAQHKEIGKNALVVNLDCVGVGEHLLFIAPKKVGEMPAYQQLQQAMQGQQEKSVHFLPREKCVYPSDQTSFTHGVAVCACQQGRRIGYYCDRIHTKRDTECDQRCLDAIVQGLKTWLLSADKGAEV